MNSQQLCGRNQRLKELKKGIQFVSLLALSVWLVYRINHLHGHDQVSAQSPYIKFSKKHVILGCKSKLGWLTQATGSYVENVIFLDTTGNPLANFEEETSNNLEVQQKYVHGDTGGTVIPGLGKERGGKDSEPIYDTHPKHHITEDNQGVSVFYDENGFPPDFIDVKVTKSFE